MKKIIFLLLSITSCFVAFADQNPRGVVFEKDGLIYTIASEYIVRKANVGRKPGEPEFLVKNEGEVYVTGVTASDKVIMIPTVVSYPTTYCRSKEDTARYNVLGIGEKAFEGARLKDLIIPYGLKFIGDEAFRNIEITNGVLVVPPVRKMKMNIFDGVKSKVLFTELQDTYFQTDIPIYFDKTFQNTNNLPELYVSHSCIGTYTNNLDKSMFYTIGQNIFDKWVNKSWAKLMEKTSDCKSNRPKSIGDRYEFRTIPGDKNPKITIKTAKKFEKLKTDIDMLPPHEYECWNTYTHKREIYSEFTMNESIFRLKKGKEYFYFSLDGKPITNKESLIDKSGKDPFGLQVQTEAEVKAKRASNERKENLDNKVNDLKKVLGF